MSRIVLLFSLSDENELSEKYEEGLSALGFWGGSFEGERYMVLPASVTSPMPVGASVHLPVSIDEEDGDEVEVMFDVVNLWYYPMLDVYWVILDLPFDPHLSPEKLVQYLNENWVAKRALGSEFKPC